MSIQGFGKFDQASINSAFGQRFIAGEVGQMTITAPSAAELGIPANAINTAVKVHIRVNTSRHEAELANDFIKRGRPYIFELLVSDGFSSIDVAAKLVEAFASWEEKFHMSDSGLAFTWVDNGDGTIGLTLKSPYLNFQNWVGFLTEGARIDVKADTTKVVPLNEADGVTQVLLGTATTGGEANISLTSNETLSIGDVITIDSTEYTVTTISNVNATDISIEPTAEAHSINAPVSVKSAPVEPTWDGKYLEENVRMSTGLTSDSYGISPDEKPYIAGEYCSISFKMKANAAGGIDLQYAPHAGMGIAAGDKTLESEMTFTLYYLEGSDVFASGGTVEEVVGFLAGGSSINTFYKANGQAAADAADFIA